MQLLMVAPVATVATSPSGGCRSFVRVLFSVPTIVAARVSVVESGNDVTEEGRRQTVVHSILAVQIEGVGVKAAVSGTGSLLLLMVAPVAFDASAPSAPSASSVAPVAPVTASPSRAGVWLTVALIGLSVDVLQGQYVCINRLQGGEKVVGQKA